MKMTEEHKRAMAEGRNAKKLSGESAERLTPVEKAKANPTSLRFAINAKCWECEGGDADPHVRWRIGNCLCESTCPLHNVRPYQQLVGTDTPASLVFPREKVLVAR